MSKKILFSLIIISILFTTACTKSDNTNVNTNENTEEESELTNQSENNITEESKEEEEKEEPKEEESEEPKEEEETGEQREEEETEIPMEDEEEILSPEDNEEIQISETSDYTNEYKVEEGYLAPDFSVQLIDGTQTTLSSFRGTPIILNFWATWCGPCCGELPAFVELQNEYGSNLVILAVDCGEDWNTVSSFAEENNYTFRIGLDPDGAIGSLYPTTGIPYTLIIDSQGVIQYISMGASDANTMYEYYKECIDSIE